MFQILAHSDLFHQFVLVTVHSGELTDVSKGVLESVCQLKCVRVRQAVLDVGIDDELGEPQNLSAQMERVSEPRLLSLFGRQRFDRLQVEVVVQMQVIQILPVDQQVQHVVSLTANLKTDLHPIQTRRLEEFGGFERSEQVPLFLRLRRPVVQRVQDVILQQLLVADANFDRLARRTVLSVPAFDQWHVECSSASSGPKVERPRGPQQSNPIGSVVTVKGAVLQKRFAIFWQFKVFEFLFTQLLLSFIVH